MFGNKVHDEQVLFPDRAILLDRVGRALEHTKRHPQSLFGVLFLDMDRFAIVSESLGHTFGDRLLAEIGLRLRRCIRTADTVTHFGGDKFIILLDSLNHIADAIRVAERIRADLLPPVNIEAREIFTSACIGIAMSSDKYNSAEEVVRDAETAMRRAKKQGPGTYAIFDTAMHKQAMRKLRVESELRRAIYRQELRLHYQPIVSISTNKIKGFEALVRWQHPEGALLCPGEFLPVAEESDLVVSISHWAIDQACRQLAEWRRQFPDKSLPSVSVNLTSKYFAKQGMLERISRALCEHKLEPSDLVLEITENQMMDNLETTSRVLKELSEFGTRVSIDDFGTGYCSLSYLATFQIHSLKIDKSFIRRLNDDSKNLAIVRSIISLGHNLGLELIAEGVETELQLSHVRTLGCEYVQGYYYSRPLECELAARFIERLPR